MNQPLQLALAACVSLLCSGPVVQAAESTPVEAESPIDRTDSSTAQTRWTPVRAKPYTASQQPQWQKLTDDPDYGLPDAVVWTPVEPSVAAEIEEKIEEEAPIEDPTNSAVAIKPPMMPSTATFGNRRAVWRDDEWIPQITHNIPIGFGPSGFMIEGTIQGTDCTGGKGPCTWPESISEWRDNLDTQGNGETYLSFGFGDPLGLGSIVLDNSLESIPAAIRNAENPSEPLRGLQTGVHYAKAFGHDTSLRIGVDHLITWSSTDYIYADMTRSAYAVGSQRIRLRDNQTGNKFFSNIYITAGAGNGNYKPLEQTFIDHTEKLKDVDCATYDIVPKSPCSEERRKRAIRTGGDYGRIYPIGAVAIEIYNGLHSIWEWDGRNLNAGFSWRPFPELGLIITPMLNSLIKNCEYGGCLVEPYSGYGEKVELPPQSTTERPRLSLTATLNIRF